MFELTKLNDEKSLRNCLNLIRIFLNSDCPASELGSIVYDNPRTWYSIGFLGEMIYINSIYNASRYAAFSIRLDYEYGDTKYINVTVTEGGKLSVVFWETSGSLKLEEDFSQSVHATSMTNNSSITQKLELNPFLDSKCSDKDILFIFNTIFITCRINGGPCCRYIIILFGYAVGENDYTILRGSCIVQFI